MSRIADDILMHYGVGKMDGAPVGSGRYPLGSGENPNQHSGDFLSRIEKMKKAGLSETEIARAMGLTTTQYRAQKALAKSERRSAEVARVKELQEQGYNNSEIARIMGYNSESSVRSLLNEKSEANMKSAMVTANKIKQRVDEVGMVDVGVGVERELGVSKEKLNQALYILEQQGYNTFGGRVPQVTNPGRQTTLRVICPPDTPYKVNDDGKKTSSAIYDFDNVHSLRDYISYDGGHSFKKAFEYPASMDSSRLEICYAEDGGKDKDGLIEIRRGVDDLSLGDARYAQIRILVDNSRYIKGMAVYSDDLPEGVDVRFNTNKSKRVPKMDVLKKISADPDNPFGSLIKEHGGQSYYDDPNGKYVDELTGNRQSLSLINKRADEGDWESWSNSLPSQFLSKQSKKQILQQLTLTVEDKQAEYAEICALTNPTVKKSLLASFADDCDSAAVHLQAAALPRQKYQVIVPMTTIKDNEVYAPNYENGETVALIRFPHGGTFEIPILTVNNKLAEGEQILGKTPTDVIGINSNVAARLSGADFDGDTVMVIPCNSSKSNIKIVSTHPLEDLENFDPKDSYGYDSSKKDADGDEHYYRNGIEFNVMKNTQTEMGKISNLITDMTLKGANEKELARAVRHSMVVIDAEKHHLDYKQSEKDNDIAALKRKYQAHTDDDGYGGASTLISRAKSEISVPKRQGSPIINDDGSLSWKTATDLEYTDPKTGETKIRTQASTQMAETNDAMTLVSDYRSQAELAYADYANKMKALANQARKEMVSTGKIEYSSSAAKTYQTEASSLKAKLNIALKNAPRERQAQIIANATVAAKKQDNPDMTKAEIKKASQQALTAARISVGASRTPIEITDREWEAIQAGAISENQLLQILDNTDIDTIRQRATPRAATELSASQKNRIKSLAAAGYTTEEIAKAVGTSTATVQKYVK